MSRLRNSSMLVSDTSKGTWTPPMREKYRGGAPPSRCYCHCCVREYIGATGQHVALTKQFFLSQLLSLPFALHLFSNTQVQSISGVLPKHWSKQSYRGGDRSQRWRMKCLGSLLAPAVDDVEQAKVRGTGTWYCLKVMGSGGDGVTTSCLRTDGVATMQLYERALPL